MLRWLRRRRADRRALLVLDARRAIGFLEAVLEEARRLGVQPDEGVRACLTVLRAWADRVDR
jgi:hypothetical protein